MNHFAICVGISHFTNAAPIPPAEGEALQLHLRLQARGFDSTLLTAARATVDRITAEIDRVVAMSQPNDFVILYFSTHGGRDTQRREEDGSAREYLLLARGALFDVDLDNLLRRFDRRRVLAIIDACHAGGMLDGVPALNPNSGWVQAIASSATDELSRGDETGSAMTNALLGLLDARQPPATVADLFQALEEALGQEVPVHRTSSPAAETELFLDTPEPPLVPPTAQAHVLFGGGHPEATLLFFQIDDVAEFRASLRHAGARPTSVAQRRETPTSLVALSFSQLGLEALRAPELAALGEYSRGRAHRYGQRRPAAYGAGHTTPNGVTYYANPQASRPSFAAGMRQASVTALMDPWIGPGSYGQWEVRWTSDAPLHGLYVITGASDADVTSRQEQLGDTLRGVSWLHIGQAYVRADRTEHFGFRDGIAKPGVAARLSSDQPGARFLPASATSIHDIADLLVIENDDAPVPAWALGGSFLAYRRLNQDVAAFRTAAATFAACTQQPREQAEAQMVGRLRDGRSLAEDPRLTPVPLPADTAKLDTFDHRSGACPVFAHSRRAHPRERAEPTPPLFRRGLLFGPPYEENEAGGVERGLHFMCYQSSIEGQFEAVTKWLNGRGPGQQTAVDLLVGRASRDPWPTQRPVDGSQCTVREFICPSGGEYFFAPSLEGIGILCGGEGMPDEPND